MESPTTPTQDSPAAATSPQTPAADAAPPSTDAAAAGESNETSDSPDLVTKLRSSENELKKQLAAAEKELRKVKAKEKEAEKAKLPEQERLQQERDELAAELSSLKLAAAKGAALDKAIAGLGQGFVVDRKAVSDILDGMTIGEDDLEAKVAQLVSLAKQPAKTTKVISGQPAADGKPAGSGVPFKEDVMAYTNAEMAKLHTDEPERYKKIREARLEKARQPK